MGKIVEEIKQKNEDSCSGILWERWLILNQWQMVCGVQESMVEGTAELWYTVSQGISPLTVPGILRCTQDQLGLYVCLVDTCSNITVLNLILFRWVTYSSSTVSIVDSILAKIECHGLSWELRLNSLKGELYLYSQELLNRKTFLIIHHC